MAGAVELSVDGASATLDDLAHVALVNYGAYTSFRVEQGGVRGLDLHLARLEAEAVELFDRSTDHLPARGDQQQLVAILDREGGRQTRARAAAQAMGRQPLPAPARAPVLIGR